MLKPGPVYPLSKDWQLEYEEGPGPMWLQPRMEPPLTEIAFPILIRMVGVDDVVPQMPQPVKRILLVLL